MLFSWHIEAVKSDIEKMYRETTAYIDSNIDCIFSILKCFQSSWQQYPKMFQTKYFRRAKTVFLYVWSYTTVKILSNISD